MEALNFLRKDFVRFNGSIRQMQTHCSPSVALIYIQPKFVLYRVQNG